MPDVIYFLLFCVAREPVMSEQLSATIIAFPRMKAAPPLPDAAADPQMRLQRALASLEQALAEQRTAVARWQQSLGTLKTSVRGLGQSLETYRDRLGGLGEGVDALNRQARQLEGWADGVLAQP
jgi:septal ring factor EnvC (AmiA/AmiB activator)